MKDKQNTKVNKNTKSKKRKSTKSVKKVTKESFGSFVKTIPVAAVIFDILTPLVIIVNDFNAWLLLLYPFLLFSPLVLVLINVISVRKSITEGKGFASRAILSVIMATILGGIVGSLINASNHDGRICTFMDEMSCAKEISVGMFSMVYTCLILAQLYLIPAYITAAICAHNNKKH